MYKYNQKLPKNVEKQLDEYIERIKNINWFKPSSDISRKETDKQINVVLEAFGVKASVEYRSIKNKNDWDAAWDAARDAAWDAARSAAWGADDILSLNINGYKEKYNNGSFINLITLWEAGLYPCGVIGGKFVVYVPEQEKEIPQLTGKVSIELPDDDSIININGHNYKRID